MPTNEISESQLLRSYPDQTAAEPLQHGWGWAIYEAPLAGRVLYTYGIGAEINASMPPATTGQGGELVEWCRPHGYKDPKIAQAGLMSPLKAHMASATTEFFTTPRAGRVTTEWPGEHK